MAKRPEVSEEEVAKALLQEYASTRQEIILHVQLYKTQFRNAGIVTALAALLAPLLIGQLPWIHGEIPKAWQGLIAFLIVFTISTATLVMAYSTLASLYAMQVLGVRCERLEDQINERLQGDFLIWEHFVGQIWGPRTALKNPDAGVMFLFYVFFGAFVLVLPVVVVGQILCNESGERLYWWLVLYVWSLLTFFMYAAYLNQYTMAGGLREDIRKMIALAKPRKTEKPAAPAGGALVRMIKNVLAIPGVIALAVIALLAVAMTWGVMAKLTPTCPIGDPATPSLQRTGR